MLLRVYKLYASDSHRPSHWISRSDTTPPAASARAPSIRRECHANSSGFPSYIVNNRTPFHARLCRLLRDDHMPCALGLYAFFFFLCLYVERWDKSSYVLHSLSVSVIQPTVICAHPPFVHLMCMFSLMVSLPVLCDNTFVILNEAIV